MEVARVATHSEISSLSNSDASPQANDSESIEVLASSNCHLALLQIPHSDGSKLLHFSSHSHASTTSTDICVIDESHYGSSKYDEDEHRCLHRMEHSIDAPDFTVLHAPGQQRHLQHSTANTLDESTEVLELMDSDRKASRACSGTDSDVEVLMSEEIIDSDWSAGAAGVDDELEQRDAALQLKGVSIDPTSTATTSNSINPHQESTDHDISVKEFSHSSMDGNYDDFNRTQLINVIREQAIRLRRLELTLCRYRSAQQKLFDQVDALRLECASSSVSECNESHETIN